MKSRKKVPAEFRIVPAVDMHHGTCKEVLKIRNYAVYPNWEQGNQYLIHIEVFPSMLSKTCKCDSKKAIKKVLSECFSPSRKK